MGGSDIGDCSKRLAELSQKLRNQQETLQEMERLAVEVANTYNIALSTNPNTRAAGITPIPTLIKPEETKVHASPSYISTARSSQTQPPNTASSSFKMQTGLDGQVRRMSMSDHGVPMNTSRFNQSSRLGLSSRRGSNMMTSTANVKDPNTRDVVTIDETNHFDVGNASAEFPSKTAASGRRKGSALHVGAPKLYENKDNNSTAEESADNLAASYSVGSASSPWSRKQASFYSLGKRDNASQLVSKRLDDNLNYSSNSDQLKNQLNAEQQKGTVDSEPAEHVGRIFSDSADSLSKPGRAHADKAVLAELLTRAKRNSESPGSEEKISIQSGGQPQVSRRRPSNTVQSRPSSVYERVSMVDRVPTTLQVNAAVDKLKGDSPDDVWKDSNSRIHNQRRPSALIQSQAPPGPTIGSDDEAPAGKSDEKAVVIRIADQKDKQSEPEAPPKEEPPPPATPTAPAQGPPAPTAPKPLPGKRDYLIYYVYTSAYNEFGTQLSATDRDFELAHCYEKNPKRAIHPLSLFKTGWDFFISIVYLFGIIVLPITASIPHPPFNSIVLSIFFTVMYLFDSLITLNTLVLKDGIQLLTLDKSRKAYLKSKLLSHMMSGIPFAVIFSQFDWSSALLLTHMLRTLEIYHHFLSNPIYQQIFTSIQLHLKVGGGFMSMFILGATLVIFLHLHGNMYFLFGKLLNFDTPYWVDLKYIRDSHWSVQYTWAVFAAIGNTFPVTGYRPDDISEQWIIIVLVLLSGILYAVLVGTISSFSFGVDSSGRMYKQKMDEVYEYMNYKKLSNDTKHRVKQFYELKFRGKYFDEIMILNELNLSLRQDIAIHNCRDLIKKVPFLRRESGDGRDENFTRSIATALQPVYFIHGDKIIEQGEVGNEMYFIYVGILDIEVNGNKVGSMKEGSFFGEVALLGDLPRTATIRAQTNCILYLFHRLDLEEILKDYDDMSVIMQKVYEERMEKVRLENEEKARKAAEQRKAIEASRLSVAASNQQLKPGSTANLSALKSVRSLGGGNEESRGIALSALRGHKQQTNATQPSDEAGGSAVDK